MYGAEGLYIGGDVNINIGHSGNIYNNHKGISTRDIKRTGPNNKPATNDIKKNNVVL